MAEYTQAGPTCQGPWGGQLAPGAEVAALMGLPVQDDFPATCI